MVSLFIKENAPEITTACVFQTEFLSVKDPQISMWEIDRFHFGKAIVYSFVKQPRIAMQYYIEIFTPEEGNATKDVT